MRLHRASSDGVLFLYHDDEWRGARVADLAYPEIVTRLGSSAPSLKDVLAEGEPPGYYIIDLKQPDPPFVAALVGLVRETGFGPDRFVFQSDDLEALRTISGEIPSATTLFLVRLPRRDILGRRPSSASVIEGLRGHSVSGLSLKGRSYLDRAYVAALKERGFTVNVWTINRPSRAEHYRELGIDGLITDETRTLRSGLSGEPVSQNACGANGG